MKDPGDERSAGPSAEQHGPRWHPKSIRSLSLRGQLMILALIAVIPGLIGWGLFLYDEWEEGIEYAHERAHRLVDRVVSDFDGALRDYELSLGDVAAQGDIQAMDPASCLPVVSSYASVHLEFTAVSLHDPNYKVICSSLAAWAAKAPDKPPPELRKLFDQALSGGRLVVTDPIPGGSTGRWVTVLGYPVRDDTGAALGIVLATLDLETVSNRMLAGLREPGLSEELLITVLDRRLQIAMRSRDAGTWIGKSLPAELTSEFKTGAAGDYRRTDVSGVARIGGYVASQRTGWLFMLDLPEEEVLGDYLGGLVQSVVVVVVLILLFLFAVWWVAESIASPMRKLAHIAQAVTGRDLSARAEVSGAAEIRNVAQQFNEMLDAIGLHREQTQQMKVLEICVAQSKDMVLVTEAAPLAAPGPRIVFVNEAFTRMTGYSREQVIGQTPRLLQGPLTDRAELARIRTALERNTSVHAELVNYASNGLPYWVEMEVVPVSAGDEPRRYFVAVERDITERKQQEASLRELNADLEARVHSRTEELKLARDEAQQANRAKSSFLATMSHEIRTPMNGVIGMVEVLQQAPLPEGQRETVELIRDSAFSLLYIIDSILDFSKIEAGHLTLEQRIFDLPGLVEKVCVLQDQGAQARGVRLSYCIDPAIPAQLLGDETRIRQILVNLIGNAIKFSVSGYAPGAVRVSARLIAQQDRRASVELCVADNGIGMDEDTVARLFKPFTQADASTTRRFGGTGLGLAISANLVSLMQGTIGVDSRPGEGATFHVSLPLDRVEGDAEDSAPAWVADLRCSLIGTDTPPLLADLRASLQRLGIALDSYPDLASAARAAQAFGRSVWLVAPGVELPPPDQLPTLGAGDGAAPSRWVLLSLDQQRGVQALAPDVVGADAGALSLRTLERWLSPVADARAASMPAVLPSMSAPPAVPTRDEAIRQQRLVLVAEDNETNRKVIRRQLDLIGIAADIAVNGREALECWRNQPYALVLTDLHMPVMDGYELAAAIRTEEAPGRRTPIVALTANAMRSEEQRCLREGMDAYLTKPIRLPQLRQAVEDWLSAGSASDDPSSRPTALTPSTPVSVVEGPADTGGDAPADLAVLRELVGDDPAIVAELLQSFRDNAIEVSEQLRRCVQSGSSDGAAAQAHKLKSGARSIGARRLAELCVAVEQATGAGADRLASLITDLDAEIHAVLQFVEPAMQPHQPPMTESRIS